MATSDVWTRAIGGAAALISGLVGSVIREVGHASSRVAESDRVPSVIRSVSDSISRITGIGTSSTSGSISSDPTDIEEIK